MSANERKRAQMSAKERKRRKRAQKSASAQKLQTTRFGNSQVARFQDAMAIVKSQPGECMDAEQHESEET